MRDSYSRCPECGRLYLSYRGANDTPCLTCLTRANPAVPLHYGTSLLMASVIHEEAEAFLSDEGESPFDAFDRKMGEVSPHE
jgi:hypothetical protein